MLAISFTVRVRLEMYLSVLSIARATVTLTSIGRSCFRHGYIIFLVPLLATPRLVGTEIAHAVPLTLVAGLGHASMGNLDFIRAVINRVSSWNLYWKYVEWKSA
jgi:hypothetical protein